MATKVSEGFSVEIGNGFGLQRNKSFFNYARNRAKIMQSYYIVAKSRANKKASAIGGRFVF